MSFDKFKKLMMMTTSPHDGEVLNAIRMANAILAGTNQNWEDLLKGKVRMEGPSEPPPYVEINKNKSKRPYERDRHDDAKEIEAMFEELDRRIKPGDSFRSFVDSVHEWWDSKGFLTTRQYEVLKRALEK